MPQYIYSLVRYVRTVSAASNYGNIKSMKSLTLFEEFVIRDEAVQMHNYDCTCRVEKLCYKCSTVANWYMFSLQPTPCLQTYYKSSP